jgi:hypothetical protein
LLFQILKFLNEFSGEANTDCTSVSEGIPGDMCEHMLKKITGGGQGKQR